MSKHRTLILKLRFFIILMLIRSMICIVWFGMILNGLFWFGLVWNDRLEMLPPFLTSHKNIKRVPIRVIKTIFAMKSEGMVWRVHVLHL